MSANCSRLTQWKKARKTRTGTIANCCYTVENEGDPAQTIPFHREMVYSGCKSVKLCYSGVVAVSESETVARRKREKSEKRLQEPKGFDKLADGRCRNRSREVR